MQRPSDDDLWMFDITAWSKSTRSTPGLTARSNPRLSLPRPSTNREKIGRRKGDYLTVVGNIGGMWGKNTPLQCVLINTVVIHTHAHTFVAAKLSLGCCWLLGLSWQTGNDHSAGAVNIPHRHVLPY